MTYFWTKWNDPQSMIGAATVTVLLYNMLQHIK